MSARRKELRAISRDLQGRSAARGSLLLVVIILLMGAAFQWARVTQIDDVTRAQGKVVPTAQTQVIQSAEPGVLAELRVQKGDIVQPGQILMVFDRTQLESQLQEAERHAYALQLRIDRLQAEVDNTDYAPDPELVAKAPQIHLSETTLFAARQRQFQAELSVLDQQHAQFTNALAEAHSRRETARAMLASVEDEATIMRPLVEQRIEPETTLLALERSRTEWLGKQALAGAEAQRVMAQLQEVEQKRAALSERRATQSHEELAKAVAELDGLQPRIEASRQRLSRTDIRSPVLGVVNQILLTTIGGVTQPGQTLMEIVPIEKGLTIEAYVRPADIAFLYPGQAVKVKITAYDFSRYGGLDGEIVRIGANAITRPNTKEPVFVVEVRTNENILDANGAALEIIPGMVAQVDILAQKKTVLDYLIRPVVRVKEKAFRD